MKSFLYSTLLLVAAVPTLPAQNTPPAPVPTGAGAVTGSTPPPAAAASAAAPDAAGPVDPAVPEELKQYGLDRYDKIVEKSPFNFKIIKQEGPPAISFAADLSLAGFTIDVGKNITYASVVDKKKNTRSVINSLSPNKDGIQLVKLNRGETLLASTVTARKGDEEHEIKAEKQIVERKAVVAASVVGRGAQQAQPGIQPGGGGPGGPGRANDVQQRINQNLQPPTPGAAQPQQGGGPNVAAGGAQPGVQPAAQPQAAPMTAADQAVQRQNPGGGRRGDGQPPPQNKRRVILPPPVNTQ